MASAAPLPRATAGAELRELAAALAVSPSEAGIYVRMGAVLTAGRHARPRVARNPQPQPNTSAGSSGGRAVR